MAKKLTHRQQTVLETIRAWIRERGYPPTIRELGKLLGIKSLRGVTTHLDAIAKKGFLKRDSRARSISLSDLVAPFEQAIRVPVVGRIRSGTPILAQEHVEGHVVVDGAWLKAKSSEQAAEHFALKVRGDTMISAGIGILDGDYVIVRQQSTANDSDIVVALVGDAATVKQCVKEDAVLGKVVAVFRTLA
ncbi:MAG: repressor LexA [Candidatus Omnitrophica bacterium]|nr:repressor LexA [Candidatus Omnitrophota bacterium]